jgi:hypothetical protein
MATFAVCTSANPLRATAFEFARTNYDSEPSVGIIALSLFGRQTAEAKSAEVRTFPLLLVCCSVSTPFVMQSQYVGRGAFTSPVTRSALFLCSLLGLIAYIYGCEMRHKTKPIMKRILASAL